MDEGAPQYPEAPDIISTSQDGHIQAMEAHPISVSLGVLLFLPVKLGSLLAPQQARKLRRLRVPDRKILRVLERKKIEDLKSDLEDLIKELPGQPSEVDQDSAASTGRYWVSELRELSYDIDDFVDKLVQRCARGEVSTVARLRACLSRCRWIAEEISRFRVRLKAIQCYTSIIPNLDQGSRRQQSTDAAGPSEWSSSPPLYEHELQPVRLVGFDNGVMQKMEKLLAGDGEKKLRVVSIVGSAGVGKTTLAMQLHRKLRSQFPCVAFVRSSRKPDMKRLLTSILLQVRPQRPPNAYESCNLINTIREHLQHKRYIIMIDDLWASSTWDIICQALPDDSNCSRVLTTTEVDTVAQICCHYSDHIHEMKPLNDAESRELFFSGFSGNESKHSELKEVSSKIITKCGGFPLAIIATARLLARLPERTKESWNRLHNSLSSSFKTNPTLDGMKQVLDLCYSRLPDHLKACMLCLSIYQEDHIIWKDDLVKQWITEGFIFEKEREDIGKLASAYFYDLVNRGLIQPVDVKYNGEVLSCSVHYKILELVASKSIEENFIIAIDPSMTNIRFSDEVRRLSLQFGDTEDAEQPANLELSKVRSLVFFGLFKCLPSIEVFQLLRVLRLHIWSDQDNIDFDLSAVCKLFRLSYLEIACNVSLKQMKLEGLQYLETLKIDSRVGNVAPDIVLPSLLHCDTNLPIDIGKMTSLETLGYFDVSSNPANNEESIGKLTSLQDLRLTCSTQSSHILKKNMELLRSILPKLRQLKSLIVLESAGSSNANTQVVSSSASTQEASSSTSTRESSSSSHSLSCVSSPPEHLERVELSPRICIFSSLPDWITGLSGLRILKVAVSELSQSHVDTLRPLGKLTSLSLYARALGKRIIFDKDAFSSLEHFKFTSPSLLIYIVKGAMPKVRTLKLGFSAKTTDSRSLKYCGFKNLEGLQVISAKIGKDQADENRRKAAEDDLRAAFEPELGAASEPELMAGFKPELGAASEPKLMAGFKPDFHVQWVDSIFLGHRDWRNQTEQYQIGERASTEDTDTQADSRIASSTESALGMPNQGGESCTPADEETRSTMKYVAKQIASISRERENMTIIIEENMENRPGVLPERWVLQLQDLVYDIEDFMDMYNRMRAISKREGNKSKRIKWQARTLFHARHIVPLKHRIKSLQKWQNSAISIHGCGISAAASSGPSAGSNPPPYMPQDQLVSMVKPVEKLQKLLSDSDNQAEQQQRVISIVGCRGVGKTALAAAVYRDIQPNFALSAWVAASECNSLGELLKKISEQLVPGEHKMQDILQGKSFLLVIDGLQEARLGYDVQGYFAGTRASLVRNLAGSGTARQPSAPLQVPSVTTCIIVTTSIQSVAAACSPERHIYRMGVLGDSESKELFRRKVRSRENCTTATENALAETLSKCDGLPLAIVSVANYWFEKGQNLRKPGPGAFEAVNLVLMQCYDSLPDHGHRTCFLSLSIFPKGHYISRKSLIRRWVGEGLAVADVTRSAEEVGADRFDELVDRSLIETVLVSKNSKVKKFFRVHGLMLDFIINKAVSKEFVTLIREDQPLSNKKDARPVRRLSVDGSTVESGRVAKAIGLDHVRSLTVRHSELFDLQRCHFLRVLDLESCSGVDDLTLHCICKLMLLKYLSLRGSKVRQIPKDIKRLELLETLDIRETQVKILPMEVIMLPQLAHLFGHFELPPELEDDKKRSELEAFFSEKSSLQTLTGFVIDGNNSGFELILSYMRFLKKVKISCEHSISTDSEDLMAYSLRKSFARDNGLESLSIDFGDNSINFLESVLLEGPCMLSSIKLCGMLSRLPNFIALLGSGLSELQLSVTGLSLEDLSVLQYFPGLLNLKLVKRPHAFWGGCFIVNEGGFPSLRRVCFDAPVLPEVHIHPGGMNSLTSLHLLCESTIRISPDSTVSSKICGMHHLQNLNEIVLRADLGAEEMEVWEKEAKGHENRPKVYTVAALHVRP